MWQRSAYRECDAALSKLRLAANSIPCRHGHDEGILANLEARVSHVNPVDGADTALAVTARGAGDDERLFNALNMPLVGLGTVRLKGGPTTLLKFFSLGGRLVDTARTCSGATVRHLRCI